MRSKRLGLLLLAACGSSSAVAPPPTAPPANDEAPMAAETAPETAPVADVRPVTNRYHEVDVVDAYQWLEDPEDADVQSWNDGQNRVARAHLAALPGIDAIRGRVQEILAAPSRTHRGLAEAGGKIFALEHRPPAEQPFIVVMDSLDAADSARTLVDPSSMDADGAIAIDWFIPSHDGSLLAVSLSRGGSEKGDVHIFNVETGERTGEIIEYVNGGTAGGDLAWFADSSGFFYTRYPRGDERPAEDANFYQQLWRHEIGQPVSEDVYEIGRDFPRIAEIQLQLQPESGRLLATVQNGDGGEFAMYLRETNGRWTQFSTFDDEVVQATFGPLDARGRPGNDLYVVSRNEAPRGKIVRTSVRRPNLQRATLVVPEGEDTIVTDFWGPPTVVPTADRLVVTYQTGGPSELRLYDHRGRIQTAPSLAPVSAIRSMTSLRDGSILFRTESFVQASSWKLLNPATGEVVDTPLRETSAVDASEWEVRREMATSADGTEVPLNIIMRRGTELDGTNPCVVNGYGGYGVNIVPRFRALNSLYMDNGAIYVVANLRGGGEFGAAWHEAGNLTHKQNVFDDFSAVLRHLVERRYTSSERLGIIGGSNGGLLMGATMVQNPELAHVVVSYVGIYDMLRVELSPNGAFNVSEFGTVTNEEHFQALHAYSPYHNVTDGTAYPATLFLTGANDPRVEPWHSRKMTARLQAANAADTPILLRTSATSGHGMGTALSEEIEEYTDVFAFLFSQLGIQVGE
ncbi:MAG: prolyl oligopeptidase family protein [Polyangiales bacterium]